MSTTPNLLLSLIVASQNQKEVTANAGLVGLDEALNANVSVAMTDADYTFATGAGSLIFSNMFFIFTGAVYRARNVILPTGEARLFIIVNNTTGGSPLSQQTLTFKVGTFASTVSISDGNAHLLYSDGVGNIYKVS
jgi:hypothetical protein